MSTGPFYFLLSENICETFCADLVYNQPSSVYCGVMSLGVCCHWIRRDVAPRSGKPQIINELDERTLQLGRYERGAYSEETIRALYLHNVQMLGDILKRAASAGVRLFRVSSAMFPLADRVPRSLWDSDVIRSALSRVGAIASSSKIRLTTHPGQFCVLSSDSDSVVEKAVVELEIHGWMFDSMGMPRSPEAAINIHGGKSDRSSRLTEAILSLPPASRSRLTLENCETCYSVVDLLPVSLATGVPIVWDSHHHVFNPGDLTDDEACDATRETWPSGVRPLQHLSNTEPGREGGSFTERRKHSDMIHYIPAAQLERLRRDEIDVEIEAKLKNLAVLDMPARFNVPL